jgi:Ni,Fe-hydrogenase III large subunit
MSARRSTPDTRDAPSIVRVSARGWRDACLAAHADGERFEGLLATIGEGGRPELRVVFSAPVATRVIVCETPDRVVESIVDAIPAAAWDEREAHDLHDVRFAGHEPLRPLLDHDAPLAAWTVPTVGGDTHEVAVGPVHAGVIESGHFRFHVVGERILHLDVRLFYKRRGLEAAAAGRPLATSLAYAQRACAACAVTNTVAYAQACETALGLAPDEQLRRVRTLLLELERVYNHLHDISAICAGVGFAAGTMAYATLKERAQRVNERLTGHRFLFNTIRVAASDHRLDAQTVGRARGELREIRDEHASSWRQLQFTASLQARLGDVGVLTREDAERLGAVGPAARAAGVPRDLRSESARLWYDGFHPVTAPGATGDVASRTVQRALELEQSFALLDDLLADPFAPGRTSCAADPGSIAVGRVESPRGATVCLIERAEGRLRAMHLRTGSYANWPVLAHAVAGNLLPEFPLINKSFELCYACVDR